MAKNILMFSDGTGQTGGLRPDHAIMAITGHKTLEEVERYTRRATTKDLADRAMAKLR